MEGLGGFVAPWNGKIEAAGQHHLLSAVGTLTRP